MAPLVLLGSARKNSDTQRLVEILFEGKKYRLTDLLDYTVEQYNYDETYSGSDRFMEITNAVLAHNTIVFATPVYWYAMSAYMKIFFDRLTDIVSSQKHIGRQLKSKRTFFIAVGADAELPDGFEIPFKRTSEYLDMQFEGGFYCPVNELLQPQLLKQKAENFLALIK